MIKRIINDFSNMQQKQLKQEVEKTPYPQARRFHYISFKYAFNGLKWAIDTQPNFKIHLFIFTSIIVLTLVFCYLGKTIPILNGLILTTAEFVAVLLLGLIVMSFELLNTAIEALGDEISKGEYKDFIRIAKDSASAGVLVAAFFSVVIGLVIYLPRTLLLLDYLI